MLWSKILTTERFYEEEREAEFYYKKQRFSLSEFAFDYQTIIYEMRY